MLDSKSVFKYNIAAFNHLKRYQSHFQKSLNQEPGQLSRPSLKMSTLSVQRNTEVKCTNNPVCHCDWQNKTRWLEPTCRTHVYMYLLALLTHLGSHIPFPNLPSHFQYFFCLINNRRGARHSGRQPASFPLTAKATEKQLDSARLWLFEPAFQARWLQPCSQSFGEEILCRRPSPTSQPRQCLNRAQDGIPPSPKGLLLYKNYWSAFSPSAHTSSSLS